jgi:hypothetical protein
VLPWLGYASEAFGADRDAVIASAYVQDGADLRPGTSLFGSLRRPGASRTASS